MSDLTTIFDNLGGVTCVARETGLPLGTVSAWKTRGSIPARHWTALVALAKRRGAKAVTHAALAEAHASPAPETQGSAA